MYEGIKTFSKAAKTIKIVLENTDGTKELYTIREFTGTIRSDFFNKAKDKAEYNKEGEVVRIKDTKDAQEGLIAVCLFDERNKPVPVEDIREYSSTTIQGLYEMCLEINGLNEKGAKTSKKDLEEKSGNGSE